MVVKLGKSQHFCYNSASSRFYREVPYGQVAQSVEQRIELSKNQICPRHPSEITIKRFLFRIYLASRKRMLIIEKADFMFSSKIIASEKLNQRANLILNESINEKKKYSRST